MIYGEIEDVCGAHLLSLSLVNLSFSTISSLHILPPCTLQVEFLAQHIEYFHFLFTNAMFHSKVRAHLKIKIP